MALKLLINLSKKIPGPVEFSSIQASCSIEGELVAGQDPVAESTRLYAQAEAAVDRQLGIVVPATSPSSQPIAHPSSPAPARPSTGNGNGQRHAPAPISPAQLRYLQQLLDQHPGALQQVLADHRVASVELLTSRAASKVIDRLKVPA